MPIGIYKILNKANSKFYIGSAINISQRWRQHKYQLRLNKHHNFYLQRAWNKHTESSFEFIILEYCNEEVLIKREQVWLDWLKPFNENGYNLTPTAGNSTGVKHSEKTRKRMSDAKKKMTEETKELMKLSKKGKTLTNEHKAKISASIKGRLHSEETKNKIAESNKGKIVSKETRKKISAGNKNLGTKRGKYRGKYYRLFDNITTPPLINY